MRRLTAGSLRLTCLAAAAIPRLASEGQRVFARINRKRQIFDPDDVTAITQLGLEGIVIPKILSLEELATLNSIVREAESQKGLTLGHTHLAPTLETAWSLQNADAIAQLPYVSALIGASAKNADVARSVGYQWTEGGIETLYFRSRVVLAARAYGKQPIGGVWQNVHDLPGLKTWVRAQRNLGFSGELALHPSNVPIINDVFSPSQDEIAYYSGMVAAYEAAEAQGFAAANFGGEHIDTAHYKTAKEILIKAQHNGTRKSGSVL